MKQKEYLRKFKIPSFEYANKQFQELKDQFIEMAQIKSDFDIEKFTVKKEGNFIAHNFHFLMRQYSLTLNELRKFLIEVQEIKRKIKEYEKKSTEKIIVYQGANEVEKYADLYVDELYNRLDMLDLLIADKSIRCDRFEKMRKKLIELNGGDITNEQYQAEEPEYWKWFLQKKALAQMTQRNTGIHEGIIENIHYLEETPLINPEFQVKMRGKNGNPLDFDEAVRNVEIRKLLQTNKKSLKRLENDSR